MLKKGLSIVLALILLMGTIAVLSVSFSAAETELSDEAAAADLADEGAEAVDLSSTGGTETARYTINVGQTLRVKVNYASTRYEILGIDYEVVGDNTVFAYNIEWTGNSEKTFTIIGMKPGQATLKETRHVYDHDNTMKTANFINLVITVNGSSSSSNLSTPKITGCESLDSGVKISWNSVSGAARYRVYYYGSNGWTNMGSTTSNSFVDTDVVSGGKYLYTVRCVNAANTAFTSDFDRTGYSYTYNMATPQITSLTSSSAGVKITWGKVTNASRYRVYYKNRYGDWVKMTETTGTTYTDSDVRFGNPYTYTVRCVNSAGRFTSNFNRSGWRYVHYLATPQITGCESLSNGVKIKWNAVSGAEKYRVYYKNSKGSWTKMGETSGTSFVDDDVRSGAPYTYTVRCINNSLNTFMSDCNTNGYRYTYNPQFSTPHITSCDVVSNGINIKWGAVSGVKRYAVYYLGSGGWRRMKETTSTSFLDTDVRYGNPYTYTVRCLTDNGKDFASDYDRSGTRVVYYATPKIVEVDLDESDGSLFVDIDCTHHDLVDHYGVWYLSGSDWVYIGETTSGWITSPRVKLTAGKTYTFTVQGYDASDKSNTYYNEDGYRMYVWSY